LKEGSMSENKRNPIEKKNSIGNAQLQEFDFTFGDQKVTIEQYFVEASEEPLWMRAFRPEIPKGATLWPAAIILCNFLASPEGIKLLSGKRVLELGAGVGLCGLLASRYCEEVVMTDGDEMVVKMLESNVKLNQRNSDRVSNIKVTKLFWGAEGLEDLIKCIDIENGYDIIIGSDLVYQEDVLGSLWTTVDGLLKKSISSLFLVCQQDRGGDLIRQMVQLGNESLGFKVKTLPLDGLIPADVTATFNLLLFQQLDN